MHNKKRQKGVKLLRLGSLAGQGLRRRNPSSDRCFLKKKTHGFGRWQVSSMDDLLLGPVEVFPN